MTSVWFEGATEIDCTFEALTTDLEDLGAHYTGVIARMPGLSSVELVEQGKDFVTIRTNEGVMKRTNITRRVDGDTLTLEFDEEYQAGSLVTTRSHFVDAFSARGEGVTFRTVMSGVEAPGLLGFVYRKLGSSKIGNAFLNAYKAYLEAL